MVGACPWLLVARVMGFLAQVGRPQEVGSPNPLNGTPRKKEHPLSQPLCAAGRGSLERQASMACVGDLGAQGHSEAGPHGSE